MDALELPLLESFTEFADSWVAVNDFPPRDLDKYESSVELLVISYNFAPYSDASAVTVAKRLRDFAEPVHVISQDLSSIRSVDPQLSRLILPYVVKHFTVPGRPTFAAWKGIASFVAEAMHLIKPNLDAGKYRRIYSRSMFPASHFLAAHIKSLYPDIHWIAEFSDPIRHTVEGTDRPGGSFELDTWASTLAMNVSDDVRRELLADADVFKWCELLTFEIADELWFTNHFQMSAMLNGAKSGVRRSKLQRKSVIHGHPTMPDIYYGLGKSSLIRSPGKLYVGYFGEFYPNRGLGDLFKSLLMMQYVDLCNVVVHVYTSSTQVCIDAVNEAGLGSIVHVHPSLGFLDFCTTARSMDILVVCDVIPGPAYDSNPYLPSKVSDYLGANKDIMAFIWPGSALSNISSIDPILIGDTLGGTSYLTKKLSEIAVSYA